MLIVIISGVILTEGGRDVLGLFKLLLLLLQEVLVDMGVDVIRAIQMMVVRSILLIVHRGAYLVKESLDLFLSRRRRNVRCVNTLHRCVVVISGVIGSVLWHEVESALTAKSLLKLLTLCHHVPSLVHHRW